MSHDPASDQIAAYLDWYFDRNPVHAGALGAPGYSHRLGDFSATAFDSREREITGWLARFEAEPVGIDRDLVVSVLRGDLLLAEWPVWRRDPSVYLTPVFAGLLLPFLHRLHPESELVDAAVARLAELPAALASCRANLDPGLSAPRLVRRALGQASPRSTTGWARRRFRRQPRLASPTRDARALRRGQRTGAPGGPPTTELSRVGVPHQAKAGGLCCDPR